MAKEAANKQTQQTTEKMKEENGNRFPMKFDVKIGSIMPEGSVRATASVNVNDAIAIRNVRIMEGSKGLFMSMPSYKGGDGQYRDICFPITAECRQQMNDAVIGAYEQAILQSQSNVQRNGQPDRSMEQAPQGQAVAMAGM